VGAAIAIELIELHVHLEGTVRRDTALDLARLHGEPAPPPYDYVDLDGFFAVYFPVAALMRTAADFERVIMEHATAMADQRIAYSEVSFNPSLHPGTDWLAGVSRGRDRARKELRAEIAWLVELVRGGDGNDSALDVALGTPGVVGLGLVGDESIGSAALVPLLARARARGLRLMPHAGQTGGPEVIREAVEVLGAERIAHGVSALRDRAVCELLVSRDVCLCVCPSSNRRIGLNPDYGALAAAGIALCVNTDDPAMVGTTLSAELDIAKGLGLSRDSLLATARRFAFGPVA
jgi:adenosine deaminase